jgi:hypothetical protein
VRTLAYKVIKNNRKKTCVAKEKESKIQVSLSSNDFIFSQASIVSSVMLEEETHCIHPLTSKYVNSNGDCWSNESLKANYKSFIGAYNYVNHVQEPEEAVGFLADASLRRIILSKDENVFIYYSDILVATHRDHEDLVKKILSNKIQYMSMGCDAVLSICSKCGNLSQEDMDVCECILRSKGKYYIDHYGRRRIIAEILGTEKEGTVQFIESSWLTETPAFGGAVKRNILQIPEDYNVEIFIPQRFMDKEAIKKYINR